MLYVSSLSNFCSFVGWNIAIGRLHRDKHLRKSIQGANIKGKKKYALGHLQFPYISVFCLARNHWLMMRQLKVGVPASRELAPVVLLVTRG